MAAKIYWLSDYRRFAHETRSCQGCRWSVALWKLPTCALGYRHSAQGGCRCRHYEPARNGDEAHAAKVKA